jgi:hypothetical protein
MYDTAKLEQRRKKLNLDFPEISSRSGRNFYTVKNFFQSGTGLTATAEAILHALEISIKDEPLYRRKRTA